MNQTFELNRDLHEGHNLTFKPKKTLKISMHLGGEKNNFGFVGGGRGDINFKKNIHPWRNVCYGN